MQKSLIALVTFTLATILITACGPKKASQETGDLNMRLQSSGLVLIDFMADGNADCMQMQPIVEKASAKHAGKLTLIPVDINKHPQIALGYGVTTLPHYAIMNGSVLVTNTVGSMTEAEFQKWLDRNIATQE